MQKNYVYMYYANRILVRLFLRVYTRNSNIILKITKSCIA